ncbi:MAG: thioredoxin domain-containing protein, partial [Propionibacteriaceae bacterium]|nr:thioredoxin domain-containing protein [Propionibacteriaceae bacterium]
RSANAWLEVAANAPEAAFAFLQELFASQPEEYTEGLTDGQIADLATAVGVPAAVSADFAGRAYGDWLTEAYHQAMEVRQIGGTPRVFIDGEQLGGNIYTAGVLKDAVEAAARG